MAATLKIINEGKKKIDTVSKILNQTEQKTNTNAGKKLAFDNQLQKGAAQIQRTAGILELQDRRNQRNNEAFKSQAGDFIDKLLNRSNQNLELGISAKDIATGNKAGTGTTTKQATPVYSKPLGIRNQTDLAGARVNTGLKAGFDAVRSALGMTEEEKNDTSRYLNPPVKAEGRTQPAGGIVNTGLKTTEKEQEDRTAAAPQKPGVPGVSVDPKSAARTAAAPAVIREEPEQAAMNIAGQYDKAGIKNALDQIAPPKQFDMKQAQKFIAANAPENPETVRENLNSYMPAVSMARYGTWSRTEPDWKDTRAYSEWVNKGIKLGAYDDYYNTAMHGTNKVNAELKELDDEIARREAVDQSDAAYAERKARLDLIDENKIPYTSLATNGLQFGSNERNNDAMLYDAIHGGGAYDEFWQDYFNGKHTKEEADAVEDELDLLWSFMKYKTPEERLGALEDLYDEAGITEERDELLITTDKNALQKLKEDREQLAAEKKNIQRRTELEYSAANMPGADTSYHEDKGYQGNIFNDNGWAWSWGNGDDADAVYWFANHSVSDVAEMTNNPYPVAYEGYFMTPEMVETFNAYYNNGDYDTALEYYGLIKPYLQELKAQFEDNQAREQAREPLGWLEGIAMSVGKPNSSFVSSMGAVASMLGVKSAQDKNSDWYRQTRYINAYRDERGIVEGENLANQMTGLIDKWAAAGAIKGDQETIDRIKENARETAMSIGKWGTSSGYSIEDNLVAMGYAYLFGGANVAGKAFERTVQFIMSAEATGDIMVEALGNGTDPVEASIKALGGGIIEGITEKYSLEALLKPDVKEMLGNGKALMKYLGKNIVAEGSEEIASEILNTSLDNALAVLYGHENEIRQEMKQLMANDPNMTEGEALEIAWTNWLKNTAVAGLTGGFTGGVLAGGRVAMNSVSTRATGSRISKGGNTVKTGSGQNVNSNVYVLAKTGADMRRSTNSNKMGRAMMKKLEAGETVTNHEIGQLAQNISYETNESAREKSMDTVRGVVSEKLQGKGINKDAAEELADIVSRAAVNGVESLNRDERNTLMKNESAYQIYSQMAAPENVGRNAKGVNEAREIAQEASAAAREATVKETTAQLKLKILNSGAKTTAARADTRQIAAARKKAQEAATRAAETIASFNLVRKGDASDAVVIGKENDKGEQDIRMGQIDGFKNGKVQIRMEDGSVEEHELGDIEAPDENTATLIEFLRDRDGVMSDDVAGKAIVALAAKNGKAGGRFAEDVINLNAAARMGLSRDKVNVKSMDKETADVIYQTAKNDADKVEAERVRQISTMKPGQGKADFDGAARGSKEWNEKLAGLSKERRNQVEGVALFGKFLGIDVHFTEDNENRAWNAHTNPDGSVTFNIAATNARTNPDGTETETGLHHIYSAAGHDFTHILRQNSKEGWIQLRDYVFDVLEKQGVNIQAKAYEKMDQYNAYYKQINDKENAARKENGQEPVEARRMTIDDAVDEMIAESCANIMASDELANKLKTENRGLYNRIRDYVRELLGRIRNGIAGMNDSGNTNYYARRIVGQDLEGLAKRWLGAAEEAAGIFGARQEENIQGRAAEEERQKTAASINSPYVRESLRNLENGYNRAVENGDMETAQWVIDQAAEAAMENSKVRSADGKLLKMYHGTRAQFNTFRRDMIGQTGRFEGAGFNFTPYEGRASSYGGNVMSGYLNIERPLSADRKTISVAKLAQIIQEADPTGDNIIANYADGSMDYGTPAWVRREAMTTARKILKYSENDVDIYSEISAADPDSESLIAAFEKLGYDGLIHYDENGNIKTAVAFNSNQFKKADPVTYQDDGVTPISLTDRFNLAEPDTRYSLRETEDALQQDLEESDGTETHYGDHQKFSIRVTDPDELKFLNNQKTVKTYKTMQLIDGKLYPPMAAVVAGNMEDASELGQWEKAAEHPELIKDGNKFTLNKGKGKGSLAAAYNPYMHSSNLMINDQFTGAYDRDNLVTVECEVPVSELDSGYHAEFAKDSVGWHSWHTGPVAGQIRNKKGIERQVMLSRWIKPMRIVSESEVAKHYADLLEGTDIEVPDNVVPPALLKELKKQGVPIKESGRVKYSLRETEDALNEMKEAQNEERELRAKYKELTNSEEFKAWMDRIYKADKDDLEKVAGEYAAWEKESGLAEVSEKLKAAEKRRDDAVKNYDKLYKEEQLAKEKESIEKSGLSEEEWRRKEAVKEFGYTTDFREAGYMLPNGKLLNFTGEKGKHYGTRGQDHRAIGTVYADPDLTGSDAMLKFMEDGNIRVMAETPGIDISSTKEPTAEQYARIRDMAQRFAGKEYFNVDFTDGRGNTVDSIEYDGRVNGTRIVNDIKTFFKTGKAPQQSAISQFHYSFRDTTDMDVNQWMMTVSENSLQTEAEKKLLRDYKGLRLKISLDMEKQRGYQQKIDALKAKDELTKEEKYQLQGLQVRMENSKAAQAEHEKQLAQVTSGEGYARMMYQQSRVMDDFLEGRTQDEVNAAVETMERMAAAMEKEIEKTRAELEELAKSEPVRRTNAMMDGKSLDDAAGRILKENNSTMDRQELRNEIARIRFKAEAGMDIKQDMEDLAGKVLAATEKGTDPALEQLRGETIVITKSQLKELAGKDGTLKEVRRRLAGTGIKVKLGDHSTLVDNLQDLQAEYGANMDFGGELDSLDNFLKWVEKRREDAGQDTGYTVDLQGAMADIALRVMDVKMNMASDPAARKQMLELHRYIVEMAGKTEEMSAKVKSLQNRAAELLKSGKKAAAWSKSLKNDIGVTVDYYNRMAKLAEDTAKQRKQSEIIRQLKDKHTQEMLKANQEWRDLIERDRNARHQLEDNQNERKKMHTVVTRLMKLLSGPTGTKNIPEYLNGLARELVSAFVNSDTSDMRRKITFINREQLTEMRRRLQAWEMRDGGFDEADLANAYDEETGDMILWMVNNDLRTIWDAIEEWNGEYRGKNKLDNLRQMGATLTRMQEAASEIYSIIKNAQQVALGDRKVAVADAAGKVRLGTEGKRKKEWTGAIGTKLAMLHKAVVSGNMTPEYFFRTIGNAGLTDLWNEYHRAENRNGLELAKAKTRFAEIAEKHGYGTWDTNKRVTLQLEKGGTVNMTVGQLMSLWATWKREQTLGPEMSDHLRYGGFYVEQYDPREGILGRKETEKKAHRVTEGDMAQVESLLTEEQRNFIDDVVGYMSSELSQLGNEASMKAYGIKLYKEKYYFPMQMWNGIKDRKSNDSGAAARQNQAFHPSFSKSRTHGANNALIIGDFMQTAADHAVGMINYATMGLANENFQKVLNHKVTEGYGDTETTRNIKAIMEEAYGKEAMQYLEDLKVQLNGGAVKIEKTFYDKLISLFRKNAVAGSLSVALQQPLSYIRAAMLIHPKYLTAALNPATWKGSYREMMEHSGVAVIKNMGRFDMNFGQSAREYVSPEEKESAAKRIWGGVVDLSTMLPELMDRMTWTRMWSAVKAEQHAEHPEMDMKSDAFLDLCGERFNEVMRRTQVYDSVLVKSANMRSQSTPVKMLTSFMAEPTLTLNVLADSVRMAKEGEAGGKGMMAKAGAIFLLSAVLQAAVKGLMGSGRTPDDKKTWLENFLYRFEYNLLNEADPLQLIPGFSDLMTVLKGGELKDDAYGTIQKMYKAGSSLVDMLTGKDNITYRNVEDSAGQLVQLFTGMPAKNIMRDARAMWNWAVEQPYADRPTSASVLKGQAKDLFYNADNMIGVFNKWLGEAGYSTDNKGYYQRIYDAKKAGNDELADELTEYLTAGKGIKEDSIATKVTGLAKSDDSMSAAETAEFLLNEGANAEDYVKKQLKAGEMTAEDARRFLAEDNREKHEADPEKVKLKSADDIWWTVDRIEYGMETGEQPGGNAYYYRLKDAIKSNRNDEIKAAVNSMIEHGKKKEDIKEWIGKKDTGFKTAYLEATGAEKVRIKDALIKAYKAVGVSEAEANKIINGWK